MSEGTDRRPNNDDDADKRSDGNIKDRIAQFYDIIFQKKLFLHPFRYFSGTWFS